MDFFPSTVSEFLIKFAYYYEMVFSKHALHKLMASVSIVFYTDQGPMDCNFHLLNVTLEG